mgnify:CR=1 FL=1
MGEDLPRPATHPALRYLRRPDEPHALPGKLFKVQRELLSKYHVTSANQYYSGEDFWQTPVDPTESQSQQDQDILQPPYYLTLQTGGTKEPVFSLTSTYIPAGQSTREILTGFLSVDSDAGNEKGKIGSNYGTIRLQELPKDSNVPGPGQAQNNFNANADVSKELNLLQSGDTQVVRGNLLTLPLGGGLVYVQPVYVKSSGATSFPLLKKTLVAFGDQVGFADTLDEALDQVFGGDSGAAAGDARTCPVTDRLVTSRPAYPVTNLVPIPMVASPAPRTASRIPALFRP